MVILEEYVELKNFFYFLLFLPTNICFNSCHVLNFPSYTLKGSIYLCHMDLSLVTYGNGVMTNDWRCHDEIESLLWVHTQGCDARHVLVSWLIVVFHYGIHRCVLSFVRIPSNWSLHSASFCCNVLYKSIFRMLSDNISWFWHLQPSWTLHASLPLKVFALNLGVRFF